MPGLLGFGDRKVQVYEALRRLMLEMAAGKRDTRSSPAGEMGWGL